MPGLIKAPLRKNRVLGAKFVRVISTEKDWFQSIRVGGVEICIDGEDEFPVGGFVGVGVGDGVGPTSSGLLGEGVGVGVLVAPRVKDQTELQSLQVPEESLALTRQYQVPLSRVGV